MLWFFDVVLCDDNLVCCFTFESFVAYDGIAPEVVEKPGDNSLSKLKNLYAHAKELSESEVKYVLI